MTKFRFVLVVVCIAAFCVHCGPVQSGETETAADYSGVYCLNLLNQEMSIQQDGESVTFSLPSEMLQDGTGEVSGDSISLKAVTQESANFSAEITFSADGQGFSGLFEILGPGGETALAGTLLGEKGPCPQYDLAVQGLPHFVEADITELDKIEEVSKFRSGFGHSFTDGFEVCRSMKHYFSPYAAYRENNLVEIYAPVSGTIISVMDDGHGASVGLTNKAVQIRPDSQPAFTFELFHVDLVSAQIVTGKRVEAGELLGYARMYYEDLDEHATSFDVAVWANTPAGTRLVSYFEVLTDPVFAAYQARGAASRQDFIISQQARDADPLECSGETFNSAGNLENWFVFP